ncbi:hypothetical protein V6R21_13265 [Limibacter armeniacum]|uniref:hypothetical protein n=1 Tax=Limibacter armeniacum TaxID=466084 RepID=UPI002FE5548C
MLKLTSSKITYCLCITMLMTCIRSNAKGSWDTNALCIDSTSTDIAANVKNMLYQNACKVTFKTQSGLLAYYGYPLQIIELTGNQKEIDMLFSLSKIDFRSARDTTFYHDFYANETELILTKEDIFASLSIHPEQTTPQSHKRIAVLEGTKVYQAPQQVVTRSTQWKKFLPSARPMARSVQVETSLPDSAKREYTSEVNQFRDEIDAIISYDGIEPSNNSDESTGRNCQKESKNTVKQQRRADNKSRAISAPNKASKKILRYKSHIPSANGINTYFTDFYIDENGVVQGFDIYDPVKRINTIPTFAHLL